MSETAGSHSVGRLRFLFEKPVENPNNPSVQPTRRKFGPKVADVEETNENNFVEKGPVTPDVPTTRLELLSLTEKNGDEVTMLLQDEKTKDFTETRSTFNYLKDDKKPLGQHEPVETDALKQPAVEFQSHAQNTDGHNEKNNIFTGITSDFNSKHNETVTKHNTGKSEYVAGMGENASSKLQPDTPIRGQQDGKERKQIQISANDLVLSEFNKTKVDSNISRDLNKHVYTVDTKHNSQDTTDAKVFSSVADPTVKKTSSDTYETTANSQSTDCLYGNRDSVTNITEPKMETLKSFNYDSEDTMSTISDILRYDSESEERESLDDSAFPSESYDSDSSTTTVLDHSRVGSLVQVYRPWLKHHIQAPDIIELLSLDERDTGSILSKHKSCPSDAVEMLLDTLARVNSKQKWQCFMDALHEKKFFNLYQLLAEETEKDNCLQRNLLAITKNDIRKRICFPDFQDLCVERQLLYEEDTDRISTVLKNSGVFAAADELLRKVDKHLTAWDRKFAEVLRKSHMEDVAKLFEMIRNDPETRPHATRAAKRTKRKSASDECKKFRLEQFVKSQSTEESVLSVNTQAEPRIDIEKDTFMQNFEEQRKINTELMLELKSLGSSQHKENEHVEELLRDILAQLGKIETLTRDFKTLKDQHEVGQNAIRQELSKQNETLQVELQELYRQNESLKAEFQSLKYNLQTQDTSTLAVNAEKL